MAYAAWGFDAIRSQHKPKWKWLSTAAGGAAAGPRAGQLTVLVMPARFSGVAKMHLHCASILLVRTPHIVPAAMPRRADLRPAPVASVAALG
jgi:hypothetical protein